MVVGIVAQALLDVLPREAQPRGVADDILVCIQKEEVNDQERYQFDVNLLILI